MKKIDMEILKEMFEEYTHELNDIEKVAFYELIYMIIN